MNKSYSKIRHIQKSNFLLESRLLMEQEVKEENINDNELQYMIEAGFVETNKVNLPDGQYKGIGQYWIELYDLKDCSFTGYIVEPTGARSRSAVTELMKVTGGKVFVINSNTPTSRIVYKDCNQATCGDGYGTGEVDTKEPTEKCLGGAVVGNYEGYPKQVDQNPMDFKWDSKKYPYLK